MTHSSQHGTLRLKSEDYSDRDQAERQTVIDGDGYQWHLGPNETKVFPDNAGTRVMASNATVKLGQSTQQATAPEVIFDGDDNNAIT